MPATGTRPASLVSVRTRSDRRRVELGLPLALVLALGPTPSALAETAPLEEPAVDAPAPLLLDIGGVDQAALEDELRLRLPERPLLRLDDPDRAGPAVYVVVRREGELLHLSVVLPGGDAYDHSLADVEGQSARVTASGVAALLDAIGAGDLAPTRTDVEIPVAPTKPEPEPLPRPEPLPQPEQRPRPAQTEPPPAWELGARATPQLVLGIAPATEAPALAAVGGAVGLDLRHRDGAMGAFGIRAAGRSAATTAIVRLRLAVGGGWSWRWGSFELPVLAAVTVEPWWALRDGRRDALLRGTEPVSTRPALGGLLAVAPGLLVPRATPRGPTVRLGLRVEAAGSFVPDGGARTVALGIEGADGHQTTLRLGGLELVMGLDATVWFGLPRPRR